MNRSPAPADEKPILGYVISGYFVIGKDGKKQGDVTLCGYDGSVPFVRFHDGRYGDTAVKVPPEYLKEIRVASGGGMAPLAQPATQPTMEQLRALRDAKLVPVAIREELEREVALLDARNVGFPTLEDSDVPSMHTNFAHDVVDALFEIIALKTGAGHIGLAGAAGRSPAEVPPNWPDEVQEAQKDYAAKLDRMIVCCEVLEEVEETEGLDAETRQNARDNALFATAEHQRTLDALCAAVWRSAQQ